MQARDENLISELLPIGIYRSTPEGRLLYVNPVMVQMFGFPDAASLLEVRAHELYVDPSERERWRSQLDNQPALGAVETAVRRQDGSEIWISDSVVALRDETGTVVEFLGVVEDISVRKRVEVEQDRLRSLVVRAAHEWHQTFDAIEYPILVVNATAQLLRINEAGRALAGREFQDLIGSDVGRIGPGEPWPTIARRLQRADPGHSGKEHEFREEGGSTWSLAINRFEGDNGTEDRFIIVVRDTTRITRLRQSSRQNEKMSELGFLVGSVAHQVRNPLFGISATLDAFEARFGHREEYGQFFSVLRTQLRRVNELICGLVDYGRPIDLAIQKSSIDALVSTAIASLAQFAEDRGVELEPTINENTEGFPCDETRIVEALRAVIDNAIHHSPTGSTVQIEASCTQEEVGRRLEIRVLDSGSGFLGEELTRSTEPFYSRRRNGVGLGLAVTYRIVEEHGGSTKLGNRPEGGAVVTLTLPWRSAP